jgi:hypothetical protein
VAAGRVTWSVGDELGSEPQNLRQCGENVGKAGEILCSQPFPTVTSFECQVYNYITFLSQLEDHPCRRKGSLGHCRCMWH